MSGRSSARRRARRRRSIRRVALLAAALLVTAAAVYVGLQSRRIDPAHVATPTESPSPTPSNLADVDLSDLPIERQPFCETLDDDAVEDALGAAPSGTSHYGNGDRVPLTTGLTDVSHEYNCTFDAATGSQARVWVFAEPVTAAVGQTILRDARRERGCSELDRVPMFGTPSLATLCRPSGPARHRVTLRGLFGDAWLTCQLSTPAATGAQPTIQRAGQWCVRVATTLGARP
jgi:hypothetical protein